MYTYFITPNDVKELTNISDNLSEKYILTAIREAQQTELTTVLGIHFITKLEEAVNKGEVPERYSELLDNYILYFLCYNVISKLIPIASVKIDNAGAVTTGDEKVENLSLDEVFRLQDYYTQKSDYYKMRLQRYLRANKAKYPELDCTSEIHSAYSSPIFLGGKRGKHIIRPCHGCSGHIYPEKPDTPDTPEKPYYKVLYTVDGYVHDFDEYQEGERIIPAIAPEKDGYTFQYWEGLPEYMPAHDITVSAVYQEIPSGEQVYYTLRYRVADWREDGEITFDNMAYIPEPFEWLQVAEREYDPNTREGWAKLTHPNLRAETEIKFQKFTGHDALFMLDLSEFNNAYLTDRLFAENTTLREFYPPKGLVGMDGYDFYNCQYLTTINFATADGYQLYQPYSYPMTGAFCNCVSLTEILADNQQHMYSEDGNLYNNSDELIAARYGEVYIKHGCTCIKGEALKAHGLSTLTIPASVRKIEAYAVAENQSLTDVYFGGTMDEWANIEKDDVNTIFVDTNVTIIHCSDGDCPVDYAGGGGEEPMQFKIDVYLEQDYYTTQWYNEGDLIVLPEPPVLDGFTFQNWNWWDDTTEDKWISPMEYMPARNLAVYATYTANIYKLTYKVDGEIVSEENVAFGAEIVALENPVKEGHTFSGWSEIPETMPAHDVEINGTFTVNSYKLVYKVDGEVISETEVEFGTEIVAMENPTKEGYTFSGWDNVPATMPANDVEINGTFTVNSYKLTYTLYDENGDVYLEDYVTYHYGDVISPYLPDIPEGYTFNGWDNEPATMPAHDVVVTGSLTKVEPAEKPYEQQYLTIERTDNDDFNYGLTYSDWTESCDMSYSVDDGATWTRFNQASNSLSMKDYRKIMFKATTNTDNTTKPKGTFEFNGGGRCIIYGNIMSLVYGDDFVGKTDLKVNYEFANLFEQVYVTDASNLILPSTTLVKNCYNCMFRNCSRLTEPPTLPATTLADYCYNNMFMGCTSLTTPPELPATKLAPYCYQSMFDGCTSLTTAPVLPATTMANSCYNYMFKRCTSLTAAPVLPATTMDASCYSGMFMGCTSLTTPPQISATTVGAKVGVFQSMFDGCTSLTKSPVLKVTSLRQNSYYSMFSGCTNLSEVTMLATSVSAKYCLSNWMNGVAETGTFYKSPNMPLETIQQHVPSGWTILDYAG